MYVELVDGILFELQSNANMENDIPIISKTRIERLKKKYGDDLKFNFDKNAQPDFSDYVQAEVTIADLTADHATDANKAWGQLKEKLPVSSPVM